MAFRRLERFPRFILSCRTKTSQSAEERSRLTEYRKNVTQLRKQFHEEWLAKERQTQAAFSGKVAAAELEARKKEEASFEANQQENKRMAKLRAETLAVEAKKQAALKEQRAERHQHRLAKLEELRQAVVEKEKEKAEDFITMENLDAKIAEALDNPRDYNFALSQTGEVLTTPASKPPSLPVKGW